MAAADPFIVHVARLRRNSGSTSHEVRSGPVELAGPLDAEGIDPGRSVVPSEAQAQVDVTLMAFDGGIDAKGTVRAPWVGVCRRCATPVSGELVIALNERFALGASPDANSDEADFYPIVDDTIDLGPMAATRWSSSSRPPRCAGRIALGCAPPAVQTATREAANAAALPRPTRVGLISTCSGS